MISPPPREPVICPLHNDVLDPPMVYIQTWDGRDIYECPHRGCTCSISYPAAQAATPHAHGTPAPLHSDNPADWHDPEI